MLELYGSCAFDLKKYIKKYPNKLSEKYQFTEGEAIYVLENEFAMNSSDIVNNRFGVGYYDVEEAYSMIQKVDNLLVKYLGDKNIKYEPDKQFISKVLNSLGYELVTKFKKSLDKPENN